MAGDWLKWVKGLTRRDEVVRIAMLLKRDRRYVASLCMEFWEWVDESTVDGFLPSATVEQVDIVVDLGGFGEALASVGWIVADADGIHVTNFDRHNGESAKARALAALRKARQRKDTPERDKCHATTVTNVTLDAGQMSRTQRDKSVTREEKRREEKSKEGFTELLVTENPKHNQSGSIAPQRAKPRRDAKGADKPKNLTVEEARQHNLPLTWDLEMREAFAKFIDQRYASGRKCTAHAIDLLVKDVEKMPVDLRLDAINQSTANGYQGIFMPNARKHTKANLAPANTAAAQPFLTLREVIDKARTENIAAARQNGTHKT